LIAIYRKVSEGIYTQYHDDDQEDGFLPITTTYDGTLGETTETLLYVKNDNELFYYTDISVTPIAKRDPDDVSFEATGHGVKVRVGETRPTEAEWDTVDYGAAITLDDLGASGEADVNSALPFWCRVECPAGATADNRENVVLRLSFTEDVV